MKSWVGVVIVLALLALGAVGYFRPELLPPNVDWANVAYLLMALLLVSGAAYGFGRLRVERSRILINIAIWAAIVAVITSSYWLFRR